MKSKFTGGLLGLIGTNILQFLLCLITLGIGAPWAICIKQRWLAKHTIIDGQQLYFDGTGAQLFGNYPHPLSSTSSPAFNVSQHHGLL